MRQTKLITYKHLVKGQELIGWKEGSCHHMTPATVEEVNAAFIKLCVFGKFEQVSSEATMFEIPLTQEEIYEKYKKDVQELVKNIQIKLASHEIGYHEMWNSWLNLRDPYDMAAECRKHGIRVIGHCADIVPKTLGNGELLDIGVCCEYEDGERFWCHESSVDLSELKTREMDEFIPSQERTRCEIRTKNKK